MANCNTLRWRLAASTPLRGCLFWQPLIYFHLQQFTN
jgi:hypothetical protein